MFTLEYDHPHIYIHDIYNVYSYMIRLYATPLRLLYVISYSAIVDLICIVPNLIELVYGGEGEKDTDAITSKMLRVLKCCGILRVFRLLNIATSVVHRQILATFLTFVSIIVFMAGVMQIFDQCPVLCSTAGIECQDFRRNDGKICLIDPDLIAKCMAPAIAHLGCCQCQSRPFLDWIYFVVVR
jgi:hypothetical protein